MSTDNQNTVHSSYTNSNTGVKYQNVIELIESDKVIADLDLKLSGVMFVTRNGRVVPKRIRQPRFTDEFIKEFIVTFRLFSNPVMAQTTWDKNEIKSHLRDASYSIIEMLATIGDDNFISEKSWQAILDVHNEGKLNKNNQFISGWKAKIGYDWHEDSPISHAMLVRVKDPNEDYDQFIIMRRIWWEIFPLLDGSLRRSLDGLTLNHHQEVIRETHVQEQARQKEGFLNFFKKGLGGLGKKDGEVQ